MPSLSAVSRGEHGAGSGTSFSPPLVARRHKVIITRIDHVPTMSPGRRDGEGSCSEDVDGYPSDGQVFHVDTGPEENNSTDSTPACSETESEELTSRSYEDIHQTEEDAVDEPDQSTFDRSTTRVLCERTDSDGVAQDKEDLEIKRTPEGQQNTDLSKENVSQLNEHTDLTTTSPLTVTEPSKQESSSPAKKLPRTASSRKPLSARQNSNNSSDSRHSLRSRQEQRGRLATNAHLKQHSATDIPRSYRLPLLETVVKQKPVHSRSELIKVTSGKVGKLPEKITRDMSDGGKKEGVSNTCTSVRDKQRDVSGVDTSEQTKKNDILNEYASEITKKGDVTNGVASERNNKHHVRAEIPICTIGIGDTSTPRNQTDTPRNQTFTPRNQTFTPRNQTPTPRTRHGAADPTIGAGLRCFNCESTDRLREDLRVSEERLRKETEFGNEAMKHINKIHETIFRLQKQVDSGCDCKTTQKQFDASRRRLLADLQQRRNSIVSLETELQLVKYNLNQVSVENSELKAKVSHLKTDAVHLRVAKRAMEAKVEADKLVKTVEKMGDGTATGRLLVVLRKRQSIMADHLDAEIATADQLRAELKRQDQLIADCVQEKKTLLKDQDVLREQVKQLKKEKEFLYQEFEDVKTKMDEKGKLLERMKNTYDFKIQKLNFQLSRSDIDMTTVERKLTAAQEEVDTVKEELRNKDEELSESKRYLQHVQNIRDARDLSKPDLVSADNARYFSGLGT